jgi:lipid-binding SYLF domain-containing protein
MVPEIILMKEENNTMDIVNRFSKLTLKATALLAVSFMIFAAPLVARAETAKEIDVSTDVSLESFAKEVKGAKEFLQASKGVLVFPKVYKAGFFWLGGEYGEGALRIEGKTADYYNIAAGSLGFQLGAQVKTVILVFLQKDALEKFRKSEGWKAGVDGSVAVADVGVGQAVDSTTFKEPIIGFIIDQKGLMYNLTLEGAKFTKINK